MSIFIISSSSYLFQGFNGIISEFVEQFFGYYSLILIYTGILYLSFQKINSFPDEISTIPIELSSSINKYIILKFYFDFLLSEAK
jgi:hypothetical protein